MIRVLIADDHTMFREGMRRLLEDQLELDVVAEAATSEEALDAAKRHQPELLILDMLMPGRGGLDVLTEIKAARPQLKVLIVTSCPESQYAVRCLRAGADGYVTKDRGSEELVGAVRQVLRGEKYVTDSLAQRLALSLTGGGGERPHEKLSDREFEVLRLIASGRTVSDIGRKLHLSVKTVSTYRTRILQKMNLRNNAEIMRYAMAEGLVH